jgi:hypothetical protein
MKIEVAVAAWGFWVERWRTLNLPVIRAEAEDVGANLVVYTDEAGFPQLAGEGIDEFRPLPPVVEWFDQADGAHVDAIDRALAGDYAVAPLCASLRLGRGTLAAAARRLEAGYRACMALCIQCGVPERIDTAAELSRRIRESGFGWWGDRTTTAHPGHYAWRSSNGAVLVRPIYHHPVLLRPTRPHKPRRAADHFMTEGYLDDIGQVAQLDPLDGCIGGLPAHDDGCPPAGPARPPQNPAMATPEGIAAWMLSGVGVAGGVNAMPWNLHYMAHRFWCGEPGADRLEVEVESDRAVAEIRRAYFERVGGDKERLWNWR